MIDMYIECSIYFKNKEKLELSYDLTKKYMNSIEPDNFLKKNKTYNKLLTKNYKKYSKIYFKSSSIGTVILMTDDLFMNLNILDELKNKLLINKYFFQ